MSGSSHAHGMTSGSSRGLTVSGWLTGVYFVIEFGIGIYSGSIAVLSDAFHTFSAVGGVVLAIVAARIARKPATENRTFGSGRAEIVGALINGAFLAGMAIIVLVMGYMRLQEPIDLPTTPMFIAAAGGLATEMVSLWYLYAEQRSNLNTKGAYWHVLQTFVGSLLIIVAAVVIRFTGFVEIDPILGMTFGVILLWASWGIMKDSVHILLEGAPEDVDMDAVISRLGSVGHVTDVHHVHAWSLTSDQNVFSAHLTVDDVANSPQVLKQAHQALRDEFGFRFATVQIEDRCLDESGTEHYDFLHQREKENPGNGTTDP